MLSNAGQAGIFFNYSFDAPCSHTAIIAGSIGSLKVARIIKEEGGEGIVADTEIILYPRGGGFIDENRAVFTAFTADDEFATLKID